MKTAKMNYQRYVLFLFICLIAGSNSLTAPRCRYPSQLLMNTAVYEGNSCSFFNRLDHYNVKWEIAPSSDSPIPNFYTVADDNLLKQPFVYSYTINRTRLSIPKASIYFRGSNPHSTSGLYRVTYKTDDCQSMANLVVVSKGPLCLCTKIDSDKANLSCELDYGVTRLQPNYATMIWYDETRRPVSLPVIPEPIRSNPYYDVSRSTYSIRSSDSASYTCAVTFTPLSGIRSPNMATNAPNFAAKCTVANCVKSTATTSVGYGCSSHSFSAGFIMMTCLVSLLISFELHHTDI